MLRMKKDLEDALDPANERARMTAIIRCQVKLEIVQGTVSVSNKSKHPTPLFLNSFVLSRQLG
jgi:hypothetical protein